MELYVEEQTKDELDIDALVLVAKEKQDIILGMENKSTLKIKPFPEYDDYDPDSPPPFTYNGWVYDHTTTEMSTVERVKQIPGGWHQISPYNSLLPYVYGIQTSNGKAYAGCATIAVAQIMSYHKRPVTLTFNNFIFQYTVNYSDWQNMIAYPDSSIVGWLILGIFDDIITSYDTAGSSSNITKARSFLNSHGLGAGAESGYTFDGVWNALQYGPTYIRGENTENEGHAWVVDGARKVTSIHHDYYYFYLPSGLYYEHIITTSSTHNTVRYDWGWGDNTINTWYNSGIFQPAGDSNNFSIDVKIISSIIPQI